MNTEFKLCNCNRSMPLDASAGATLGQALGTAALTVATGLCRQQHVEHGNAQPDLIVAGCTQEHARLTESMQQAGAVPIRFVNIRETANWGREAQYGLAKTAALLAEAALPAPDPVPTVRYMSQGSTLIIGPAQHVLPWAERLAEQLSVAVLLTDSKNAAMPIEPGYQLFSGEKVEISGWLGAFDVVWAQSNPIDLEVCVGCNACVAACPEGAIDALYQVDMERCRQHGDCIAACGPVGAIDFAREGQLRRARFDLILDLSETPLISLHQPPQGYFAPGNAPVDQFTAVLKLTQMVGEFEKPKYFQYKERLCAHGRNRKVGCSSCVDVCSAGAIQSSGNKVQVTPQLCMGCGACTTVCPSGAISYAYPTASYMGQRLKASLEAYARAGGVRPVILLHSEKQGRAIITALGKLAKTSAEYHGIPARVIPLQVHHTASVGIEVWMAALTYGASAIGVLATDEEAPQYIDALAAQMTIAQTILTGLGYSGRHFQLIRANDARELDSALREVPGGEVPRQLATYHVAAEKRNTLDFILDHLHRHAPNKPEQIALPAGAPFGAIRLDTAACTLCMSCVGACPKSALIDSPDKPQLSFIEKNCVQCGLCAVTCPEQAITLVPQISFAASAKNPVLLNESEPFCCIRCNKPMGTLQMVENMLSKLSQHSAFSGNLDRLRMCGDCRVVDMMQSRETRTVVELKRQ